MREAIGVEADVAVDGQVAVDAGRGSLRVARAGARSVVTKAYATSPLRLLTPSNHGRAAWVYTSSYGGGLVDGDRIVIDVDVTAGATAFVSTQASTKVYRSPNGTTATLNGRVGHGALLVMAPDPVVCFADARYRQRQRFDVDEDGALVVVDAIVAGRCAAGERWAFREYHSLIDVVVGGRWLVHDPVALSAADGELAARMGRFDVLAVVVIAGAALREDAAAVVAMSAESPVTRCADHLIAASPLGGDGCIVRIASTSVGHVRRTIRELLAFVAERLEDDPWTRKW